MFLKNATLFSVPDLIGLNSFNACATNLFLQIDGQGDEIATEEDESISKSPPDTKEEIWMMQDQLIMAKAYLHFASPQGSTHLVRELKLRMKEIGRAISHSSGGSHVPGT
jgi:alpha-1,4-galacturonosyltransferase